MGYDTVAAGQEQLAKRHRPVVESGQHLGGVQFGPARIETGGYMRNLLSKTIVVGALAAGLALVAGWAVGAGTPVTFQLNWMAGGPNAGFAAAVAEGFYKDAGLDVTIVQGNGSANTAQLVANGRAQLAYADAVSVSQLIAKGAPMRIVATIYQSNPNAVMALKKTGIKSVKDLAGKKVGVPSASSQTTMLPLLLKANNLKESDITMIDMPVSSMVPALLQGQVDAVLGSIDAYQIQAESQGAQLDVYKFADFGVPTVSTSIFASDSYLKDNAETVKKFIAASLKGWSFALDNPEKTIKDLKTVFPEVNEKLATAELAAITPLFCSGGAKYLGKAEDALWAKSQDLLSEVKLLPAGQDPKTYYTNDYLPPPSAMRACK
jgi:NitT/TauT family transport system substrate-binding protein